MPVADEHALEELHIALGAIHDYISTSPALLFEDEAHGGHGLLNEPLAEADQQHSSLSEVRNPSKITRSADQNAIEPFEAASPPSQSPFPDVSGSHTPPASAGGGAWDPWAEELIGKSPSSPRYQPGSSDSDWGDPVDDPHPPLHDYPDNPDSPQDHPPFPSALGQDHKQDVPKSIPEPENPVNPRVASALADAQHRLDQLVGLAASHAEVQQTLSQGTDLSYAWGLMPSYTQQLQCQVESGYTAASLCVVPNLWQC